MTITPQNSQNLMNKDEALSLIHEIKNDVNSIRQKLMLLKTKEGWKSLGYESFEKCCDKEFKTIMSSSNFYDLLAAVKTEEALNKLEVSDTPENISLRALKPLNTFNDNPDLLREAFEKAKDIANKENEGRLTQQITQRAKELTKEKKWTQDELERQSTVKDGGTVVANMRDGKDEALISWAKENGHFQRIDRNSAWGNPYELGKDGDRDTVCESYMYYFKKKLSLHQQLMDIKGKVLGCWCYPERCHGNYLIDLADGTDEIL
jgi:hypothetical protein|tara:strand:+ start:39 stop:827 length:789 start_codon:yes stop_codon:yes gene_type:complete